MIISPETQAICTALGVDPLRTISSGTLIIAAESKGAEKIVKRLRQKGVSASIVGKILAKDKCAFIIRKDGTKLDLSKPVREELWRVLQKE